MLQRTLTIVVSLSCPVVLSVYLSVLLPRLTVVTCSSLLTGDFLHKCAEYTPESKILHLKFTKFSEVKPRPLLQEAATPSSISPHAQTMPPIMPDAENYGSQALRVRLIYELATLYINLKVIFNSLIIVMTYFTMLVLPPALCT